MTPPSEVLFLFDVDNTLLDNDRIQNDLRCHLECEFGAEARDRYWAIFEEMRIVLGYTDYLGALSILLITIYPRSSGPVKIVPQLFVFETLKKAE